MTSGVENVVATCGTALTEQQAALIRRYVPEVVVVYDGDAAGIKAALKGTSILTASGLRVRALALPDGQDPDDFVRDHGADAFRAPAVGRAGFFDVLRGHDPGPGGHRGGPFGGGPRVVSDPARDGRQAARGRVSAADREGDGPARVGLPPRV